MGRLFGEIVNAGEEAARGFVSGFKEGYDPESIKVDPKTLSAGEMQILISSLIWAMFRIAGRREMFIFDTPLARLDKDNRQNFIEKIIKQPRN